MGHYSKKNKSSIKNFWIFRIAGMLAAINAIRSDMINTTESVNVQNFITYLSQAGSALYEANQILRKIDYTKIVK
jgi:hypothetical protein